MSALIWVRGHAEIGDVPDSDSIDECDKGNDDSDNDENLARTLGHQRLLSMVV
jgi:hypothetical protein